MHYVYYKFNKINLTHFLWTACGPAARHWCFFWFSPLYIYANSVYKSANRKQKIHIWTLGRNLNWLFVYPLNWKFANLAPGSPAEPAAFRHLVPLKPLLPLKQLNMFFAASHLAFLKKSLSIINNHFVKSSQNPLK